MSNGLQDYFYICPVHLKDRHFCSPVINAEEEEAKKKAQAMEREIENVKKEYEERQKKKKEKEKDKKVKNKDDFKDASENDSNKKVDPDKKEEKERDDKVCIFYPSLSFRSPLHANS